MIDIPEALERILDLSKADACIAIGHHTSQANVRWANNTSTTNGAAEHSRFDVISLMDGRVGSVRRTIGDEADLTDIVRASEAACDGKPQAEDQMPLLEGNGSPPTDWADPPGRTAPSRLAAFASDLADTFARAAADDTLLFGYAEHVTESTWLATSAGIRARSTWPNGKVEITGKSPDFKRSTWAGSLTSDFSDVDLGTLYEKLSSRLAWSERTIELPAGDYEVLLEPAAVADMALYQYISSARRDADEGRTVFSKAGGNKIGEKLMGSTSLYSDPREPGLEVPDLLVAAGSSSYASVFDNGLRAGRVDWVEDGVLRNLITTRHWAERSGAEGAVPFVANLVIPSTGPTLEEMIASTRRALLITCFWYIREVDPQILLLTGLTRDGVFLIEDGEVVGAVNNFRFNMSPVQMLDNAVEAGTSEPTPTREWEFAIAKMPPLRVERFHMSSVSEAT